MILPPLSPGKNFAGEAIRGKWAGKRIDFKKKDGLSYI
jgi:hypothetical protein